MPDPIVEISTPDPVVPVPEVVPAPEPATDLGWLLELPEELQNDSLLVNFKSVEELAKGYSETKRWADREISTRVKLPDENTTPEDVNKFYQRLGVPEKPEEYEFSKVETPAGLGVDMNLLESFKSTFHAAKLTKKQADIIQSEYLKTISNQHNQLVTEYKTQVEQQIEILKNRWGDKFEANRDLAIRTFDQHASPGLKVTVEKENWGNHPDFVELFYKIGVATSEDKLIAGTPEQQKTLEDEIKTVETKLYNTPPADPEYNNLLKKRAELYERRYSQPE